MSFKHFLEEIGHDALAVLTFGASTKGQQLIGAVENGAVIVGGLIGGASVANAITSVEGIINKAFAGIITAQALGQAAADANQTATGEQKAAAVLSAITPDTEALLISLGVKEPTANQVQEFASVVNEALVNILKALPATSLPAPTASPVSAPTPVAVIAPAVAPGVVQSI